LPFALELTTAHLGRLAESPTLSADCEKNHRASFVFPYNESVVTWERSRWDCLDSVGGFVKGAGDGIARAAGNGYKAASDTWNTALGSEGENLVLRSGSANKVAIPSCVGPLALTHPFDPAIELPQAHPSRADVNVLNDRWTHVPNGPPPASDIIWGSGPDQVTRYHATGLNLIPDPTKGGLKPLLHRRKNVDIQ